VEKAGSTAKFNLFPVELVKSKRFKASEINDIRKLEQRIVNYLTQNGMNTLTINKSTNATEVWFKNLQMIVRLDDGREIAVPIDWFPRLRDATEQQRNNWRLIGGG
jgi:Protein of unknown function (DUF2442)